MKNLSGFSIFKKCAAFSMAALSFCALSMSSLSASACSISYVSNENQLKQASTRRGSIIVTSDICLSSQLRLDRSVNLDLKGHKLYPSPSYSDYNTVLVGSSNRRDYVDVAIQNGFIYGVCQPIAKEGSVNYHIFDTDKRNGRNGAEGGCAIKVDGAHLYLNNVSVYGGNGGNGGNGIEARVRAFLSGVAGRGGRGGDGGNAISIYGNGVVDANTVYAVGGAGGLGGNGGSSLVGYISGDAGNGGNGGNAVYIHNGTFNVIHGVTLVGGNGGNAGVYGYSSTNFFGNGGNGGNAGHGIFYTIRGYHANSSIASISGGRGGCGIIPGQNGEAVRYKR